MLHNGWTGMAAMGLGLMISMEAGMGEELSLTTVRVLDAPVEAVWRALTEADSIAQWWGPQGFTAPKVETDVRVGGVSLVCMAAEGFPLMCNSWTYREIEAPSRMVFDQGFVDESGAPVGPASLGLPPDIPAVVPHRVELRALDGGRTELTWIEEGYGSPETVAMSKAGLDQVLDKLATALE